MLLFDYFKYNVVYKNCKIKYLEYNKNRKLMAGRYCFMQSVRMRYHRAEENEVKTDEL